MKRHSRLRATFGVLLSATNSCTPRNLSLWTARAILAAAGAVSAVFMFAVAAQLAYSLVEHSIP